MLRDLSVGVLVAACLSGCAATPERVFKKMQSASCSGDVVEFFRYVNKTAMLEWSTKNAEHKMESDGAPRLSRALLEQMAPRAFAEEMQSWEDEVKRNKDGDWCRAEFVSADNDGGRVVWKTPTGKMKTGFFEKSGDTFLMVGIE